MAILRVRREKESVFVLVLVWGTMIMETHFLGMNAPLNSTKEKSMSSSSPKASPLPLPARQGNELSLFEDSPAAIRVIYTRIAAARQI
jgi:hypothetical protein